MSMIRCFGAMFIIVLMRKRSLPAHVLLACVAVGVRRHDLCVVQVNLESFPAGGGCLPRLLRAITLQVIISRLRHRDNGKSAISLRFNDLCIHKCLSAAALKVRR